MKTPKLLIGTLAMALSFSACQNKSTTTETGDSTTHMSSDSSHNMESSPSSSPMMGVMDKMMKDMHQMQMTGNVDYDLTTMLIHHHQGAIDMSEVELQSGTDQDLKTMAQTIIDKQKKEIQELEGIAAKYKSGEKNYDPNNKNEGLGQDLNKNMMSMMKMNHGTSTDIDHQFASMMKKHHEDGVEMGEIILKHSQDAKFKSMTEKTMADQKKDIEKLEQWLNNHQG